MTLQPLIDAPWAIKAHVATLLPALVLGAWLLAFSHKGSKAHRWVGALFFALMVTTALITLFIHRRSAYGPFGFGLQHLFIPFTLFSTWRALDGALKGNIKQHRAWVFGLYFGSLIINGAMNIFLFPGAAHDVFFSR